ncbi:rhodanese-like domain-containing protein [Anaerococcus sp. mt242]|uniref:rhodanese-like domain-containing protein n=1 Tax=unclassified Anaerococcus TaxID=2614126 RepID=UPI001931FCDD|nr:rhodanese-like domain-containing protein [Anaerococcus sp. mt242]MBM0046904.1 rhodanese-like domain-containing protein [Anaerococcus sp. mt242]
MIYKLISGNELEKNLENYFVIDARTREEFKEGHIPYAINIPYDEVLENLDKIKTDKPIVLYCGSTRRSEFAADMLTHANFSDITIAPGVRLYDYKMTK